MGHRVDQVVHSSKKMIQILELQKEERHVGCLIQIVCSIHSLKLSDQNMDTRELFLVSGSES